MGIDSDKVEATVLGNLVALLTDEPALGDALTIGWAIDRSEIIDAGEQGGEAVMEAASELARMLGKLIDDLDAAAMEEALMSLGVLQ